MYDGENGWAIPTADDVEDPDRRDDLEAAALYDLIEHEVAPRVLRPRRRRPAAPVAGDGAAHAALASARRCSRAGWCTTTSSQLYTPAAQSGRAVDGPGYVAAKELADLEGPGAQGLAVRAGRPRRVQRRRREPGARPDPVAARHRLAGRPHPGRRGGGAPARAGRRLDRLVVAGEGAACPWPRPSADGTYRYDGVGRRSSAPGRSATPSGCCPTTPLLANSAEMNLVAVPAGGRVRPPTSPSCAEPAVSARSASSRTTLRGARRDGVAGGPRSSSAGPGRSSVRVEE